MKLTPEERLEVEAARQLNPDKRLKICRNKDGDLIYSLLPLDVKPQQIENEENALLCPAFGGGNQR